MNLDNVFLSPPEERELELTVLSRPLLPEQYRDLEQEHETNALGMWVFLATEVMFFGTLFLGVGVYRSLYPTEFEKGSEHLNWVIGGSNTIVLLISSLMMVLAVHHASHGDNGRVSVYLLLTLALGVVFLGLKMLEYYIDYQESLIPGLKFDVQEWIDRDHLRPDQVPHVELFLLFYWIMTLFHALHVTVGLVAILVVFWMNRRGDLSKEYYVPVDVLGLYWHFVDTVWIFLLPMLYLLGTHHL